MSSKKKAKSNRKKNGPYPFEFRLRAVKLYLEEGYSPSVISEELGISNSSLSLWVKCYRERGEEGVYAPKTQSGNKSKSSGKLPEAVKEKIVELKKESPSFGVKRISQVLKRFFFMGVSSESVRKTLHDAELMDKPSRKKPKRNIQKPRFFERATPNQMWQSDIMCFRLAGRNAYLIGYMDDYSRYITSLGLYRSQTAEHVIETYRRGISEYGVPKEMLTDNGRQYTNWRGTTRFEKELQKDRVKHIKSRPHHPMTLGKIERFWKTILSEFLSRVQFRDFEDARSRLEIWVKYYNHKRPHQGIGGLCPADRFFEIQHELRRALDSGVADNALELALRGKPVDPFYMVGRMGEQNVVIRAEKGKVRMMLDGEDEAKGKELVYELEKKELKDENKEETRKAHVYGGRESQSGFGCVEREAHDYGNEPGDGCLLRPAEQVAESCHGGNAQRAGIQNGSREDTRAEPPAGEASGEEIILQEGSFRQGSEAYSESEGIRSIPGNLEENVYGQEETEGHTGCRPSGGSDPESPRRTSYGGGGGQGPGGVPQDLLQMGEAGSHRPCQCPRCTAERQTGHHGGGKARTPSYSGEYAPEARERSSGAQDGTQGHRPPDGTEYYKEIRQ